ncbi:hypothetical protein [Collimonas sp.]|jgi:hypothetical protein|uniref:hypothetical protein n=1 Tax=Collimonas sp. TaxID=1963772 RepID=UPI002C1BA6DF|nr:hypothetical protein [Collimonas sp.]HWW07589.1 hypothetical protein [Collimonas sp.]
MSHGSISGGRRNKLSGYDVAGQRRSANYADGHSENYNYTNDGYLEDVQVNGSIMRTGMSSRRLAFMARNLNLG